MPWLMGCEWRTEFPVVKSRQRGGGAIDRPPRCPLPVVELCLRMSALAAA